MLDIDFIRNFNYVLQNKDAFAGFFEEAYIHFLWVILLSIAVGWITRKIWKEKRSVVISFIAFIIPFSFLFVFFAMKGAGAGPSPKDITVSVYILIILTYWLFDWNWNKFKKKHKMTGVALSFLIVLVLTVILLNLFAGNFRYARTHPYPSRNTEIVANMSQLRTHAVIYAERNSSYAGFNCQTNKEVSSLCDNIDVFCPSGEGSCRGDDLEEGTQDLIIHSNEKSYCAYTPLPRPNEWYCVNSRGAAWQTNINPGQRHCTENNFKCPD